MPFIIGHPPPFNSDIAIPSYAFTSVMFFALLKSLPQKPGAPIKIAAGYGVILPGNCCGYQIAISITAQAVCSVIKAAAVVSPLPA